MRGSPPLDERSTSPSSSTSRMRSRPSELSVAPPQKHAPTTPPEVIARRLAVYHEQTEPVVEHYRAAGILVPLHAEQPVEVVFAEIESAIRPAAPAEAE